jgi:protein-L-isoaspartate(D-aspartate) O-methyltransferase
VLEVGGGSGYHAAVLARIARVVWSIERIPELAARARAQLRDADVRNVYVLHGDGTLGYPPAAPYDAIVVAAAAPAPPAALLEQLAPRGRLVMPVGPPDIQELVVYERTATGVRQHALCACCFVPLVTSAARAPW